MALTQEENGGYDYQFLDPGPTDDQTCPICHHVVKDAHQVTCCGKLMCQGCLLNYLQVGNSCPMCRESIGKKYFKDTRSDREIKNLKVFCVYKGIGCTWSGELRDIEDHMQDCVYQEAECQDCEELVLLLRLNEHMLSDCSMRRHTCPLCKEEGTYLSITTEHQSACPEVELQCQNIGCSECVKRCDMPSHVDVCSRQVIECPFTFVGCKFKTERESLAAHVENESSLHVHMVAEQVQMYHRIAPVVIKFTDFAHYRNLNENWHSNGFYTGVGGYRMRLEVYPHGYDEYKSTHLSVFVNLMPGANDDNLEFPVKGKFTLTLLNQLDDDNHHERDFQLNSPDDDFLRKHKLDDTGMGLRDFIHHSYLDFDHIENTKYLMNDTVYFRVTVDICSETKPWLALH